MRASRRWVVVASVLVGAGGSGRAEDATPAGPPPPAPAVDPSDPSDPQARVDLDRVRAQLGPKDAMVLIGPTAGPRRSTPSAPEPAPVALVLTPTRTTVERLSSNRLIVGALEASAW